MVKMMIEGIYITDYEEGHAPPTLPVLYVAMVDDQVYLEIGEYEETHKERVFKMKESVCVSIDSLTRALLALNKQPNKK